MRYLKRLLIAVLVYIAVYLPFIAVLQTMTGYDFTPAYTIGGIVGSVELALGAIIKREETKYENKCRKEENHND